MGLYHNKRRLKKMSRIYIAVILLCGFTLAGCTTHRVAVTTLDATIEDAAQAVLDSVDNNTEAVKSFEIKVNVTQGFKAGATVPIPVVPISLEGSSAVGTTLTLGLNMKEYLAGQDKSSGFAPTTPSKREVFELNTRTGELTVIP